MFWKSPLRYMILDFQCQFVFRGNKKNRFHPFMVKAVKKSELPGARTQNPRLKRPLLYRLSYAIMITLVCALRAQIYYFFILKLRSACHFTNFISVYFFNPHYVNPLARFLRLYFLPSSDSITCPKFAPASSIKG